MTKQGAELFRLCELICLAQDAGLVLGVESPPYGLLRHCRIRPLSPVACSKPTLSRPCGGRGGGRNSSRARPSTRLAHQRHWGTQHPMVLRLLSSWPSTLIGERQVSHLSLAQRGALHLHKMAGTPCPNRTKRPVQSHPDPVC